MRRPTDEAGVNIEMLSAAFSTDEGRSCVGRVIPKAVQLAEDLGGRTISMAPDEGCPSLHDAFATGRYKVVIQGKLHNVQENEDNSEVSRNFAASHRFLRRWGNLHSLAGEFSETSRYASPFIALSAKLLENHVLVNEVRALGKRANLVLFDIDGVAGDEGRLVEAVSRARKAIESILDGAPRDKRLNLAVNLSESYSAEPSMIEFVCTDEQHSPFASGRVGIVDRFEETSAFPWEDMSYLASSVCEVLWELWPARKLTLETFQGELRKRGCELSSSFVASFVDTQLRKEQLLSMYEVNALVLQALLSDPDAFVISSESNGYRISVLSRIERDHLYGTDE